MLSMGIKPVILNVVMMNVVMMNVVMLNVVMLNVVMLNVVMLNVVMLNVIMLNVVMLSVVAPQQPSMHHIVDSKGHCFYSLLHCPRSQGKYNCCCYYLRFCVSISPMETPLKRQILSRTIALRLKHY